MTTHDASGNDISQRQLIGGIDRHDQDHCDRACTSNPHFDQTLKPRMNYGGIVKSSRETDSPIACGIDDQSSEGLLRVLTYETDDLLRLSLTPLPPDHLLSESGFPLGVEKARTEYEQGLLSTGTIFRDCLPPALLHYKTGPPYRAVTDTRGSPTRQDEKSLLVSPQSQQYQSDGISPVPRPRNFSKEEQFRRINQAPLSAIFEESDPSPEAQGECACNVCKHGTNGQRIVWFHLCPRYKALALQNGIKYQPYEGRVIIHHGRDRSSLGLIIEGPMEDRFVPVVDVPAEKTPLAPKRVKAPKPGRLDPRSLHSAGSCNIKITPPTATSTKLPPVPTPALQRPISPTTVSRPSSLAPLTPLPCPQVSKITKDRTPDASVFDSQDNIHPAFRTGDVLPKEWTTAPTKSVSAASDRDDSPRWSHSIRSERIHLSMGASEQSGELPARTDSLGAPTRLDIFQPSDKHHARQHSAHDLLTEHACADSIANYAFSPPLISPSAGHERTPSEYLCPSTPSTTSNQRSSISSYGEPSAYLEVETAAATTPKQVGLTESTKDPTENIDHSRHQQPMMLQSPYCTAPNSAMASSCCLPAPTTAETSSSLDRIRSNNPDQNSPYFRTRGYHRSQASQQSTAQSLNSLRFQRSSGFTSGTTLLNGSAFENADESEAEGLQCVISERQPPNRSLDRRSERNIFTRDSFVTAGAAESRLPDILASSGGAHNISDDGNYSNRSHGTPRANPLMTVGATEAHCTSIVTAASNERHISRRASVPVGQGIADSLASPHSVAPSRNNNNKHQSSTPSFSTTASSSDSYGDSHQEFEAYLNGGSNDEDPHLPLRRSLLVQQNLCSHIKLQNYLGMNVSSSKLGRLQQKKTQSTTLLDRYPTEKKDEGPGLKRVVKKGSRRFKEGGARMVERVKAGWRLRQDDWLDSDDGRD